MQTKKNITKTISNNELETNIKSFKCHTETEMYRHGHTAKPNIVWFFIKTIQHWLDWFRDLFECLDVTHE